METKNKRNDYLIYLASPYSSRSAYVMRNRYETVCKITAELIWYDYTVFSPIVSSACLDQITEISYERWIELDLQILRRCDALVVLTLPGWEQSEGVATEIKEAEKLNLPIRYPNSCRTQDVIGAVSRLVDALEKGQA